MHDCVDSVKIYFENCDALEFDAKDIGRFELRGIHTDYEGISRAIRKTVYAHSFYLEVFEQGNGVYKQFDIEPIQKFERITKRNDISGVEIMYRDEEPEYFEIVYYEGNKNGDFVGQNMNQSSKISSLGNLYIVIDPLSDIDAIFSPEYTENNQAVYETKISCARSVMFFE